MDRLVGVLDSDNRAELSWNTFMERNNSGFRVERSEDGRDFVEVGFVNSLGENGNSGEQISYGFVDGRALSRETFYRIVQVDIDGKMGYSNVEPWFLVMFLARV